MAQRTSTAMEGIGYLAGAWAGGERGALLLQSSGVGNCINSLASGATGRSSNSSCALLLGPRLIGEGKWVK